MGRLLKYAEYSHIWEVFPGIGRLATHGKTSIRGSTPVWGTPVCGNLFPCTGVPQYADSIPSYLGTAVYGDAFQYT
jgi:hypothetical protein